MAATILPISVIYTITNTVTGRVYVGSALHLSARWKLHRQQLAAGKHHAKRLQGSWNRHGPGAFEWTTVEFVPRESLLMREQVWIDVLRSAEPQYGYNSYPVAGSALGVKHSASARSQMRAAKKGKKHSAEWVANQAAATRGRIQSPEHAASSRVANLGRKLSDEWKANIATGQEGRTHKPESKEAIRSFMVNLRSTKTPEEVAEWNRKIGESIRRRKSAQLAAMTPEELQAKADRVKRLEMESHERCRARERAKREAAKAKKAAERNAAQPSLLAAD